MNVSVLTGTNLIDLIVPSTFFILAAYPPRDTFILDYHY